MNHNQKSILFFLVIVFSIQSGFAQFKKEIDSIRNLLEMSKNALYEDGNKSLEYAKVAEKKYLDIYGESLLADINYRIGTVYYLKAEYSKALEYFTNSNLLYKKANDTLGLFTSYTGLGLVEMGIENHEASIDYYRKSYAFLNEKNKPNQCVVDFNIGLNHYLMNETEPALKYFWKSLKTAKTYEKYDIEIMTYLKLSEHYLKIDNKDSCFYYLQKIKTHKNPLNSWLNVYFQKGISNYNLYYGDLKTSKDIANQALKLARQINSKWEIAEILGILSEVAYKEKEFEKAFILKKEQLAYVDSINSENTIRKFNYLRFKKEKNENNELKQANKSIKSSLINAKTFGIISLFICLFLVFILVLYRKNLKTKTKFNEELNNKNKEIISQNIDLEEMISTKTKILSIISHDMKSPLAAIKQVLMMYNDKMLTKEEQDDLLKKLLIQVESTIEMLTNLVFWAKKQASGIKINKIAMNPLVSLKNIIEQNKVILDLKEIDIYLKSDGFENTKIIIDPDQFQIICQNIIGNSIKYSYNNTKIDIFFSETDKNLKIHFIDQGIGMSEEKINEITKKSINIQSQSGTNDEKGSGLGLVLVQSLLELNNGHLEISSELNKGSEFIIHLNKTI